MGGEEGRGGRCAGRAERVAAAVHDLPNLLAEDDAFLEMVDSPALVPVMSRITGTPAALEPGGSVVGSSYTGCMRVGAMGGRVVPYERGTHGYTRWHLDQPLPDDPDNPNYRTVKVGPARPAPVPCLAGRSRQHGRAYTPHRWI